MNDKETSPWLGVLCDLRRLIQRQEAPTAKPPRTPYHERQEKVVDSEIKWKPVNKTAALVVAKANWINKPDAFMKSENNNLNQHEAKTEKQVSVSRDGFPVSVRDRSPEEINVEIAQRTIRERDRLSDKTIDLALRAIEAREALQWQSEYIRTDWVKLQSRLNEALKDMTMLRMAVERESKTALSAMGDVRKFFLGDIHVEEMSRLKEFVAVCERLEALKARGTLDAIADTILKLA